MEPLFCLTQAATPSLPLAPVPVGHLTDLSLPGPEAHALEYAERKAVKFFVVPDSSERWQTVMSPDGSGMLGLSCFSAGSFQLLILPRKTSAIVAPSSFRPLPTPSML